MATSKETQIYHAVWRKALEMKDGATINLPSEKAAQRLRFALYNAVRKVRTGEEVADQVLLEAVQVLSVGFTPDKKGLRLVRKEETGALPQLLELVGEQNVKPLEQQVAAESAGRIAGMLSEPAAADKPSANPYYIR